MGQSFTFFCSPTSARHSLDLLFGYGNSSVGSSNRMVSFLYLFGKYVTQGGVIIYALVVKVGEGSILTFFLVCITGIIAYLCIHWSAAFHPNSAALQVAAQISIQL